MRRRLGNCRRVAADVARVAAVIVVVDDDVVVVVVEEVLCV
jgi:hypothetical protein